MELRALRLLTERNSDGLSWAHDFMARDPTHAYYAQPTVPMLIELLEAFDPGREFEHWGATVIYEPNKDAQAKMKAERDSILAELNQCQLCTEQISQCEGRHTLAQHHTR